MPFSLLGLLNALSRKDPRSRRLARGVPYGPNSRQQLDIYGPIGLPDPRPVLFFVYGGSWVEGDRHGYGFAGRMLAGLGYVTVISDYRVLPEVEYPGFLEDNDAALAWVADAISAYGGDASRIALIGHSAGAYNAVMLALVPRYLVGLRERVKAVIGLSGPYDFFPFDVPISLRAFGAVRDPKSTQPVNLVTASAPPMFLASGDGDKLVYPRNTAALARALREAGVAVEEQHYAELGHPGPLLELGSLLGGRASLSADLARYLRAALGG